MRVDVLAPFKVNDVVLRLGQTVAEHTVARLKEEGHEIWQAVPKECVESSLLAHEHGEGVVFIGHGYPDQIHGSDERPLFAGKGAERLAGRWLHAFACEASGELATRVLRNGATAIAGYKAGLRTEWSFAGLDPEFAKCFVAFLTEVSARLAAGVLDDTSIRTALLSRLEAVRVWTEENGRHQNVRLFCEGVFRHLVVRHPDPP